MKSFAITLGKGKHALTLDAAKLIDRCALIQGGRDSGKSYLARVIVEQTIPAGLQTIILDPEGEFSTLREKFDILIAGQEGDVPTETRSAKLLARRIAETGVSSVVDLSGLVPQQRYEFVRIFLETFDRIPKSLQKRPRLFVLDEAHLYCPESGKGKAASSEAVVVLMSQGRKRGHGTILVTQRLSKLRKDAANECGVFFIGRTAPTDLPTAQDVLGITKPEREGLRALDAGTFWAAGSGLSKPVTQFTARRAVTTHPEPGARYKLTTPPPRRAITKILKEFESLPPAKEVEDAQTLKDAQAEVRRLTAALKKAESGSEAQVGQRERAGYLKRLKAAEAAVERARAAGAADEFKRVRMPIQTACGTLAGILRKPLQDAPGSVQKVMEDLAALLKRPEPQVDTSGAKTGRTASAEPNRSNPPRARGRGYPSGRAHHHGPKPDVNGMPFSWGSAPGKMLTVLIQYHPEPLPKNRLAALAGVNVRSSTFRNALSKLRTANYIADDGSNVGALDGVALAMGDLVEPLPSGDALIEGWRSKLGGVPLALFDALLSMNEGNGTKSEIAGLAEVDGSTSTFRNACSKLRTLGLLDPGRGSTLQLAEHVTEANS